MTFEDVSLLKCPMFEVDDFCDSWLLKLMTLESDDLKLWSIPHGGLWGSEWPLCGARSDSRHLALTQRPPPSTTRTEAWCFAHRILAPWCWAGAFVLMLDAENRT